MNYMDMSAIGLSELIRKRKIKIKEALSDCFEKIKEHNEAYNVYVAIDEEKAYKRADILQESLDKGEKNGPLFGVPVAIKDNICTKGIKTTCCSSILKDFVPCYSATAVQRLEASGMIIVGKTNMDEFAMGNSTETSCFGETKNPWKIDKVAGGSSGGSAAGVALGMCSVALGSDTGGSVRQPSAFCGITGIKPTYGRVSRNGLIAYASSMDTIGTMGKNVMDAAALLDCISGYDLQDSTSVDSKKTAISDLHKTKIVVPVEMIEKNASDEMVKLVKKTVDMLKAAGFSISYIDMEMEKYALPVYYTLACAEASSNLERYDGVKYGYRAEKYSDLNEMYKNTRNNGFGAEVKRRIMLGTFVLSAGYYDEYFLKALRGRQSICRQVDKIFSEHDYILTPVAPGSAYDIGKYSDNLIGKYNEDIFTVWANLTGNPAISIPAGKDKDNMPLGIQLMGKPFEEEKMTELALIIEQEMKMQGEKYGL